MSSAIFLRETRFACRALPDALFYCPRSSTRLFVFLDKLFLSFLMIPSRRGQSSFFFVCPSVPRRARSGANRQRSSPVKADFDCRTMTHKPWAEIHMILISILQLLKFLEDLLNGLRHPPNQSRPPAYLWIPAP